MTSRYGKLFRALAGSLLALVLIAPGAAAQDDRPQDNPSKDNPSQEEGRPSGDRTSEAPSKEGSGQSLEAPPVDDIDEMLQGEEEIFGAFEQYTYDPGERRDPFRSLLVTREAPEIQGPRPEGIPGLLIDEVSLIGIIRTPAGYIAQVQAADRQKSFLLHEGEELYDGEVVSIDNNEVVFRQIVRDPTAVKPFRERVKVLNPS
jgi:Tfp pilus assembly protein PilP